MYVYVFRTPDLNAIWKASKEMTEALTSEVAHVNLSSAAKRVHSFEHVHGFKKRIKTNNNTCF